MSVAILMTMATTFELNQMRKKGWKDFDWPDQICYTASGAAYLATTKLLKKVGKEDDEQPTTLQETEPS